MYISSKQIRGTAVYSHDGRLLDYLEKIWINPDNGHLLALQVKNHRPNLISPHDLVDWQISHLKLGQRFEFHAPEELVRVAQLLQSKHPGLIGKKVRTENLTKLGQVTDFSINTKTLLLASLTAQTKFWFRKNPVHLIHYSQIIEITPTEVIVKDSLIKIPISQSSPDKFSLQNSPTFDQA
jgi:uncharacterized protein YrrD